MPQLALPATAVPAQGRWICETKYDRYRLLTPIEGGVPRLITLGGHDWTDRLAPIARALAALGIITAWLDGEILVPAGPADVGGDFNALQKALDRRGAPAREITREPVIAGTAPSPPDAPRPSSTQRASRMSGTQVTHGARVIDAASGLTKLDLVRCQDNVAAFMPRRLHRRPVALVRGPGGVGSSLILQKHDGKSAIAGINSGTLPCGPGTRRCWRCPPPCSMKTLGFKAPTAGRRG